MKAAEWLKQLRPQSLQRLKQVSMYKRYFEDGYTLEQCLTLPKLRKEIFTSLSKAEQRTLRLIVKCWGYQYFNDQQFHAQIKAEQHDAAAYAGFVFLRRKGILMTFRKMWGEQVYALAEDSFAGWQKCCFSPFHPKLSVTSSQMQEIKGMARPAVRAMLECLALLNRHSMSKTNKGACQQNSIKPWLHRFNRECEAFDFPVAYAKRLGLPNYLAMLLQLAAHLEFIEISERQIEARMEQLEHWLCSSQAEREMEIYWNWKQQWAAEQGGIEVELLHMLCLLEQMPKGQWVNLNEAVEWVDGHNIKLQPSVLDRLLQQWIFPMAAFGFLVYCKDYEEQVWVKWIGECVEEGVPDDTIIVQSDFEILVPPQSDYRLLWQLEMLANHIQTDQLSIYALSLPSLLHGKRAGLTISTIRHFLQEASGSDLPDSVEFLLQKAEKQQPLVFQEVLLLSCENKDIVEHIRLHPDAKRWIRERIGDQHLIIHKETANECRHWLEKMELDVQDIKEQKDGGSLQNSPSRVAFGASKPISYEIDQTFPKAPDCFASLENAPSMWFRQYRRYHPSTCRRIIEQAILWRSPIKFMCPGQEGIMLPEKLQEDSQTIIVQGIERESTKEISFWIEEIEKLQIMLPEEVWFSLDENMV